MHTPGEGAVLPDHVLLRTPDLDAFRAQISNLLTPHRLSPVGDTHAPLHALIARASLGPLGIVYAEHKGAQLRADLTTDLTYYDVNVALGGHNQITIGQQRVLVDGTTLGVISPHMRAQMLLSDDYRQLHLRIDRAALERQLEELLGRSLYAPLRFDPRMDLTDAMARNWAGAVRLLVDDVQSPGGFADTHGVSTPWAQFLMTGLLLAQPHNYTDQLASRRDRAARPQPLRRALELIESAPGADLSVQRLALECGVSARSLQRHFKDRLGIGPREYVLQVRLAHAHDDLRRTSADAPRTVADVAHRWGFGHPSRFAAAYRDRYGVTPSVTRRTAVGG